MNTARPGIVQHGENYIENKAVTPKNKLNIPDENKH